MLNFLRDKSFWISFISSAILLSLIFSWELGAFGDALPKLPRVAPSQLEIAFTAALVFLLSLNAGFIAYRLKKGSCPLGARNATTVGGVLGVITLLCPACLLIPASFFGISLSLAFLAPWLPLLRMIVLILLIASTWMLFPKNLIIKNEQCNY